MKNLQQKKLIFAITRKLRSSETNGARIRNQREQRVEKQGRKLSATCTKAPEKRSSCGILFFPVSVVAPLQIFAIKTTNV